MNEEYEYPRTSGRDPMISASFALGLAALLLCTAFYLAIPCAALSILFALLSKKRSPLPAKCRIGIILGLTGAAASAVITFMAIRTFLTDARMRSYVQQYIRQYTGDFNFNLEESLKELFPALRFSDDSMLTAPETETESETEERIRLRVAPEIEAPSLAPPDTEKDTELQTSIPDAEKNMETEHSDAPIDDFIDQIPEGGESFI